MSLDLGYSEEVLLRRKWAWEDSRGEGIAIALLDSGIYAAHPELGNSVKREMKVLQGPHGLEHHQVTPEDQYGHGTACAGIIHSIAPSAEIISIRVLGRKLKGMGSTFLGGLRIALDCGARVINLSLGTTNLEHLANLHELADEAYFRGIVVVAAANNSLIPSFPSTFASLIGVSAINTEDPLTFDFRQGRPIELLASGVGLEVIWGSEGRLEMTGNSFAAATVSAICALILAKHPELSPAEVKEVLKHTARRQIGSTSPACLLFRQDLKEARISSGGIRDEGPVNKK